MKISSAEIDAINAQRQADVESYLNGWCEVLPEDENQGRGRKPERATIADFLFAVAIAAGLFLAVVSWSNEPDPNSTQAAPAKVKVTT